MASKHSRKLPVSELSVGMFVSDLDRPWAETPFPIQGFYIRGESEIRALATFCREVSVDFDIGSRPRGAYQEHAVGESKAAAVTTLKPTSQTLTTQQSAADNTTKSGSTKASVIKIKNPVSYETSATVKKEVVRAKKLQLKVSTAITHVMEQVRCGEAIDINETEQAAEAMVDSIVRNPDAMVWLAKVGEKDDYAYRHAVHSAIWGMVFGRQLGLEKGLIKHLATGLLLSQVGKARLPQELLQKNGGMTASEFAEYKTYVEKGLDILEMTPGISNQVISVVKFHRERHNGTGFPQGVTGDRIPLLGKIAGLVDFYQQMVEPQAGVEPMTASDAVAHLFSLRNVEFQSDLVEHLIRAIGVYPTGTLVELDSDEVGIVVEQNLERRLHPKVMIVLDKQKVPLKEGRILDLMAANRDEYNPTVQIRESLPFGAYDIDPARFQVTGAKRRWSFRHMVG